MWLVPTCLGNESLNVQCHDVRPDGKYTIPMVNDHQVSRWLVWRSDFLEKLSPLMQVRSLIGIGKIYQK